MQIDLLNSVETFIEGLNEKEIAKVIRTIELLEEFGNALGMLHSRHMADGLGEIVESALQAEEIEKGQETLWLTPTEVLKRIKSYTPKKSEGHFILEIEKSFLKEFLQL